MAVDTPKANGLKTIVDTIIAPKEAFESIRIAPTWGWALLISMILGAAASYLTTPTLLHAYPGTFAQLVASDPRLAGATPDQQHAALAFGEKFVSFNWIFVIFAVAFGALVAAVILLVFDKISHGEGAFSRYWAAACNIGVLVFGIGGVVTAIIVLVRGVDSFPTMQAVQTAVPSLAMVVPGAGAKLTAFLATITPFTLWGLALNVLAMRVIGRVGTVPAWLAALVILLVPGLFAMAGAK
jgi:hypothetical protein